MMYSRIDSTASRPVATAGRLPLRPPSSILLLQSASTRRSSSDSAAVCVRSSPPDRCRSERPTCSPSLTSSRWTATAHASKAARMCLSAPSLPGRQPINLVRRQVTVITAPGSTPAALAAHAATTTIPIVFGIGTDPVELRLVASLNRPGGNVTGVSTLSVEVGAKRVELLHAVVPTANTMALLGNPTSPALSEPTTGGLQAAARVLGLNIHI